MKRSLVRSAPQLVFGALLLIVIPSAYALPLDVGPILPDDWAQQFQENGLYDHQYSFDAISVMMVTHTQFDIPAMAAFTTPGWHDTGNSRMSWARTSTPVQYTQWRFQFVGPVTPTTFDYWVHLISPTYGNKWWGTRITYNGGWSYPDLGPCDHDPVVPEP